MADEGMPTDPPRFPPVDEPGHGAPQWPPTGGGAPHWPPPDALPPGYGPPGYGPPGYGPPGYGPPGLRRHWLHPLDVGRAFGSAYRIYRLHWRPILGAYAALLLPITIALGVVQALVVSPQMSDWQAAYLDALRGGELPNLSLPLGIAAAGLVIGLVLGAAGMIGNGAVTYVVDATYRGHRTSAREAIGAALSRAATLAGLYLALIGGMIAVGLIGASASALLAVLLSTLTGGPGLAIFGALIGVVGTVVAMIFIALRWSLAVQASICERAGVMQSLARSWRLVAGSTWRVLGYGLLFGVILFVAVLVTSLVEVILFPPKLNIANPFEPPVFNPVATLVQSLLTSLVSIVLTPLWIGVLTLLYYDLRWQRGEAIPDQSSAGATAAG